MNVSFSGGVVYKHHPKSALKVDGDVVKVDGDRHSQNVAINQLVGVAWSDGLAPFTFQIFLFL